MVDFQAFFQVSSNDAHVFGVHQVRVRQDTGEKNYFNYSIPIKSLIESYTSKRILVSFNNYSYIPNKRYVTLILFRKIFVALNALIRYISY